MTEQKTERAEAWPGKHIPGCVSQLDPEIVADGAEIRMTIHACTGCLPRTERHPCSIACLVTGGVHHRQESLLAATLAEIAAAARGVEGGA